MQHLNIKDLKQHPRNTEFFDDMSGEKWEEFLESIKTSGVIEPIVITQDKTIVSGHQRVRACKELGIETVLCQTKHYDSEDAIIKDLLETNIRQRGDIGGSGKKVGLRIRELERLYGIREGRPEKLPNNSVEKSQSDLAAQLGISVDTLQNYKKLTEMIPELEELVDTGICTQTTALAIMRNLSEEEQIKMISSIDTTKKITQKKVMDYIEENKKLQSKIIELESRKPEIIDKTDYSSISKLEKRITELEKEKKSLETRISISEIDAEKYKKLQSDIAFLTKQKNNLGRQIESATELSGYTVRLQKLLEEDLAPIKFKRCIEVLDSSDVCLRNLMEIIDKIDIWSNEIKRLLPEEYDYVVDIQ